MSNNVPIRTTDSQVTLRGRKSGVGGGVPLEELDRISLRVDVHVDDGLTVPAGATGTVVAVWNGGEAYEVEFTKPIEALATVAPGAVGTVQMRRR